MIILEHGFVARLYRWSRRTWESFGGTRDYRESTTDFCTLTRAILILMPLALAINLLALGFLAYSVFLLIYGLWLNLSTFGWIVLFICTIGGFIGLILLLGYGGAWAAEKFAESETAHVIAAAYRAKKASICPKVEIVS